MAQGKNYPAPSGAAKEKAIKQVAENRKARFDYSIESTMEAGIQLVGSEVKSIRTGDVNLKDSFVVILNGEAFVQNLHISVYKASSYNNHVPERRRKLLLSKAELNRLDRSLAERGYSCIPLKLYFKGGWAKLEIGLAKGKKSADKRESIKTREANRELDQLKRKHR